MAVARVKAANPPAAEATDAIAADLIAVLVAVTDAQPRILTINHATALPCGPFKTVHRSLQAGLRDWVETQTHHPLGYVEQLYTFADRDRAPDARPYHLDQLSGADLRAAAANEAARWRDWYRYFPWEDHRAGPPAVSSRRSCRGSRLGRVRTPSASNASPINFGPTAARGTRSWCCSVTNSVRGGAGRRGAPAAGHAAAAVAAARAGDVRDHRRILATGIARLRAKIKYRPVVFELMPPAFTLLQLQRSVEAIAGHLLHKQNFRRLIEQQELVEETGDTAAGYRRAAGQAVPVPPRGAGGTRAWPAPSCRWPRVDIPYAQHQHMVCNTQTEHIAMQATARARTDAMYQRVRHVIPPIEWPDSRLARDGRRRRRAGPRAAFARRPAA